MNNKSRTKRSKVASAISIALLPISGIFTSQLAMAQEAEPEVDEGMEKIQVTATRRAGTVQDVPINISAISPDLLEQQDINELEDVAKWVPESPRVCQRLNNLRNWNYEKIKSLYIRIS